MKCPNCGVENDENALYCYFCGRVLPGAAWNINAESKETVKKKKTNRVLKITLGILGGLLAASLAFLAVMIMKDGKEDKDDPKELLEVADAKYEAEDYMTAAITYDQVLELEPDNDEAISGSAMSKLYFVAEELGSYVEDEEYISAIEYMSGYNIDEYIEKAKDVGFEFPVICDTRFGTVGFYQKGDNEYYAYVGEYEDSMRSGNGCVIATNVSDYSHGNIEYYASYGSWENDKPNGQMEVIKDGSSSKYLHVTGTVKDGLWTGDVTYKGMNYDYEYTYELVCEFEAGIPVIQEEIINENGTYYRISKQSDSDLYAAISAEDADMTYGIITYADIL